jgi:hypothetical protein
MGSMRTIPATLIATARVAATSGDAATAARLVGAADAMTEAFGYTHVYADRLEREATVALIERALPTAAAEREGGRAMGLDRATQVALDVLRRP